MHSIRKRILILFVVLNIVIVCNTAYAGSSQERISGADRYRTAVAISQKGWPTGADYAVIARGDDFADALCAGPLAKMLNGPILLTEPGLLNINTLNEIIRLKVKHVIIIGGTGAVSGNIEDTLRSNGISDLQRISGRDRYETSVLIAERIGSNGTAVLATGEDYPDALSVSSIASKMGMPILLTQSKYLPESVKKFIENKKINKTYIIGGTGVIGDIVGNNVPGPLRLGGKDRYETNVLVMKQFESELDFTSIYVAVGDGLSGSEFADALSGAVLASLSSSPVILVYRTIPENTGSYIKTKAKSNNILVLGGEGAVPTAVVDKLIPYLSGIEKPPVVPPAGGGAPAGGGGGQIISPSVTAEAIIYPSMTSPRPSVGNGETIDISGMPDNTQVYGFNITVDQECELTITDINNMNLSWLLKTNTKSLSAGTATLIKLDDIIEGTNNKNDGISLKTFRGNNVSTAAFNGKLTKDGVQIGTLTITLKLK